MGCNNSSLNGDAEVLPVRLRPLLRQRMEEFRKRRAGQGGGLSRKQLLKDDVAEDGNSQSSDENEIEKKQNVVVHVVAVEKLSKVVPLPDFECMNDELQCRDHKDQEQEKVFVKEIEVKREVLEPEDKFKEVSEKHEEVNKENAQQKEANAKHEEEIAKHHDDDEEEENEEDDDDDDDYEIGRCIGPGSPSFRIYYVEAEERKKEQQKEEICEKPIIVIYQKSPSAKSNESESIESASSRNTGSSNEDVKVESAPKRKGNKIKKFGGMKKNIFHVKHLHMNGINKMMACTGNDRKSILSQH